jgi:hypothetical protein
MAACWRGHRRADGHSVEESVTEHAIGPGRPVQLADALVEAREIDSPGGEGQLADPFDHRGGAVVSSDVRTQVNSKIQVRSPAEFR